MNKVFQVNLAGIIFTIEEQAYIALKAYLERLHRHFGINAADIVADIEARMAELFQQRLVSGKSILFPEDVNEVLGIMGDVEQMEGGDPAPPQGSHVLTNTGVKKLRRNPYDESLGGVCSGIASYFDIDPVLVRILFVAGVVLYGSGLLFYIILWIAMPRAVGSEAEYMLQQKQNRVRKLFRDPDRRTIGGVCSGIASFFGLEVVWIRLAFLLSFFFFGSGFILYLILWIIIPQASTAGEKLQMRGEAVDIHSIEREFQNATPGRGKSFARKSGNFFSQLLELVFKFIIGLMALVFVATALFVFVGLIAVYAGVGNTYWLKTLIEMTVNDPSVLFAFKAGLLLIVVIPTLALILFALRLVFNVRVRNKSLVISFLGIFFIGMILIVFAGMRFAAGIRAKSNSTEVLPAFRADTVYVSMIKNEMAARYSLNKQVEIEDMNIQVGDEGIMMPFDELNFRKIKGDSISISVKKSARGSNNTEASGHIAGTVYPIKVENNRIEIPEGIWIDKGSSYHFQEVKVKINAPVGTVFIVDEPVYSLLRWRYNLCDEEESGRVLQMTAKGLKAVDCKENSEETDLEDHHHRKHRKERVKIHIGDKDGIDIKIEDKDKRKGRNEEDEEPEDGEIRLSDEDGSITITAKPESKKKKKNEEE